MSRESLGHVSPVERLCDALLGASTFWLPRTLPVLRVSKSTLANADFKLPRPDLLTQPDGDLGIATGVEARDAGKRSFTARSLRAGFAAAGANQVILQRLSTSTR
jgi:hypothetical protein